jgi:TolB-like protein/Tfp pilus assembly protein PilF
VGIAYAVGAWLLLQLTDVLIDILGLPETAGKYIVLLLVIGFPLALFFAWAFEMTPEGVKREHEVDRSQSITKQTGHKLDRTIIAILALALAFFVYDKLSVPPPEPPAISQSADQTAGNGEPAPAMLDPSIAVLPFVNMSSDPDQEYFSDGISEELLNLLVRVEGLKVASRTSSFTYKGDDLNIPAIAEELKVDHILEGSVRKAGNRVRITAQLIDVATDRHLWSDTFDRELVDIFAIQAEIANAIVSALKTELGVGLQAVSVETATENLDAYELYLKARGLFIARQNLDVAIHLFEKATELDPGFALAWEGLAAVQTVADSWLAGDGIEHGPLALASAHKALEIDPDLSMAYAVLARTPGASKDLLESMEYLDTAIENDPKNATAWLWRGITLAELGHAAKAIGSYNECLAIDPAYQNCRQHMASAYLFLGDAESAIRHFEESIMENFHSTNDDFVSHYVNSGQRVTAFLVAASFIFGDYAPIKDWVRAIENPGQNQSAEIARWKRWAESQNYDVCSLGASIVAFRFDECYFADYDGNLRVIWHPDAAYYRESQAFKDLANRQFMRYWRKHGLPPQCRELDDGDFECD